MPVQKLLCRGSAESIVAPGNTPGGGGGGRVESRRLAGRLSSAKTDKFYQLERVGGWGPAGRQDIGGRHLFVASLASDRFAEVNGATSGCQSWSVSRFQIVRRDHGDR